MKRALGMVTSRASWAALAAVVLLPACGSRAVKSGNAVGRLGSGLTLHARAVPRGGEACMMKAAVTATPGAADKPISDDCARALTSDHLWRRALVVLSAYSQRLDALASGASPETAGKLEATLTGIRGEDWISADTPEEQSARSAAAKLVSQMNAADDKSDFEKTVSDAAPHVKTLCDGLRDYLGTAATQFSEVRSDIEKRRAAKTDRRCATFDNRTVCTSESAVDRVVVAGMFGGLAQAEANHLDARDDVASFCAAHAKLESAVGSGDASKDETYTGIVDAVKAVPRAQPPRHSAPPSEKK